MKKMIWIFILILTTHCMCFGQEPVNPADTVLPEAIIKNFNKKYPKGETEDWMKEGSNYVISTFVNNLWLDVAYSEKGKWVNTATLIDYEQLPQSIIKAFESSKYKNYDVVKVSILEMPKSPKVYKIYLENKGGEALLLNYNESGGLMP